ncbi:MAG: DinB family protein [Phycisphaeraceae bacterium]|nr:DinB family protein [Phycisphaerales bacterium]MCB9841961.1 DinB family protein [Phycisphaeraceae bacterium]
MDRVRIYGYLADVRRRVLDRVRTLDEASYTRGFDLGPGSIAKVLTHLLISEWYYCQRIKGREVPPYAEWEVRDEQPLTADEQLRRWDAQTERTREVLSAERDWRAPIVYRVTDDDGKLIEVTTNADDIATQLVLHEIHHRAQLLNMLRLVGVTFDDLDFNAVMYQRREVQR